MVLSRYMSNKVAGVFINYNNNEDFYPFCCLSCHNRQRFGCHCVCDIITFFFFGNVLRRYNKILVFLAVSKASCDYFLTSTFGRKTEEHASREKHREQEQTPATNTDEATLSHELKNWTTQNERNNQVFWEKNFIQLDPTNHKHVQKSTF